MLFDGLTRAAGTCASMKGLTQAEAKAGMMKKDDMKKDEMKKDDMMKKG